LFNDRLSVLVNRKKNKFNRRDRRPRRVYIRQGETKIFFIGIDLPGAASPLLLLVFLRALCELCGELLRIMTFFPVYPG
jgi:hypothetical protein